jgi:hypothetical protein
MYSRAAPAWCLVGRGSANCSLAMEDEATKRAHGTARKKRDASCEPRASTGL